MRLYSQAAAISSLPRNQRGVALLMGMMMLLVLTLISVTAMQGSTMQERMTGNVRESNLAFQTAEDIVRQAEVRLAEAAETGTFAGIVPVGWTATGLELYDCAGARLIEQGDPNTWTTPPDSYAERGNMRYQVVEMSAVGGRQVNCQTMEEEPEVGAGLRSSYFLVIGYSEGPTGRINDMVATTYFYEQ